MLPRVVIHNASSLDGRLDHLSLDEADLARFYEIASRWGEDATLAGADTILASMASVPEEGSKEGPKEGPEDFLPPKQSPEDRRPILVVPDSRGRVRTWHALRRLPYWRRMVALVSRSTPEEYLDYLRKRHVDYIIAGADHVDLRSALEELSSLYGVRLARADSGGRLNGALLREDLVDEVSVIIQPCLLGGTSPGSIFTAPDLTSPEGAIPLRLRGMERLEGDAVWLRYEVVR